MIPRPAVAVVYLAAAIILAVTSRSDFGWAKPARWFLTAVMFGWAAYWVGVWLRFDLQVMHALGRWWHVPTAVAVILIAGSRWYAERKGAP